MENNDKQKREIIKPKILKQLRGTEGANHIFDYRKRNNQEQANGLQIFIRAKEQGDIKKSFALKTKDYGESVTYSVSNHNDLIKSIKKAKE
jgi:hypothetical protein